MMKHCVEHYARGNMRGFGRLLGITAILPWEYIQQGRVPSLNNLLRICSGLAIRPLEFLTASSLTTNSALDLVMSQLPQVSLRKGKPVTREEIECLRHALEAILAQDFHPPLNPLFLAQHLGCSVGTLRKHCPEQFQELMMRFRPNFTTGTSRERLREALEKALKIDEVKPLEAIAKEARCNTSTLRKYFPDLSQEVVNRFRNRINHDRVKYRLQEVLASNEPIPSVAALARQMGYRRTTIQAAFPDLCKELENRRRTELKKQHENRISTACVKVRQAVLTLHQQGVYPSAQQVASLLGDPHIVREKKVLETWHTMLEELGYR
jgi:AraC-like DNA-binding protein